MGRIRTIKPEFFLHEGLYDLEDETELPVRLSFAGLWTQCDREGRFRWQPRKLKVTILPYDDIDFSRVLDALNTRGFIQKYTVNGDEFGFIPGFSQHQVINNREKESELPDPSNGAGLTREARVDDALGTPALKNLQEGKGREGKGREGKGREGEGDKRKRFSPPELDEVITYCNEKGLKVSPHRFHQYFTEGKWHDSKGNPVKNWKQKILTWENRNGSDQDTTLPAWQRVDERGISGAERTRRAREAARQRELARQQSDLGCVGEPEGGVPH